MSRAYLPVSTPLTRYLIRKLYSYLDSQKYSFHLHHCPGCWLLILPSFSRDEIRSISLSSSGAIVKCSLIMMISGFHTDDFWLITWLSWVDIKSLKSHVWQGFTFSSLKFPKDFLHSTVVSSPPLNFHFHLLCDFKDFHHQKAVNRKAISKGFSTANRYSKYPAVSAPKCLQGLFGSHWWWCLSLCHLRIIQC